MYGMHVTKRFAKLGDRSISQQCAYIKVSCQHRRSMQHRRETANNHEIDVSVAKFLQQSIEFRHPGVRPYLRDRPSQAATPYPVLIDAVAHAVPA